MINLMLINVNNKTYYDEGLETQRRFSLYHYKTSMPNVSAQAKKPSSCEIKLPSTIYDVNDIKPLVILVYI